MAKVINTLLIALRAMMTEVKRDICCHDVAVELHSNDKDDEEKFFGGWLWGWGRVRGKGKDKGLLRGKGRKISWHKGKCRASKGFLQTKPKQ